MFGYWLRLNTVLPYLSTLGRVKAACFFVCRSLQLSMARSFVDVQRQNFCPFCLAIRFSLAFHICNFPCGWHVLGRPIVDLLPKCPFCVGVCVISKRWKYHLVGCLSEKLVCSIVSPFAAFSYCQEPWSCVVWR